MATLRRRLEEIDNLVIQPLEPVVNELSKAFEPFSVDTSDEQMLNGFLAAKWCIDHNLYQQAATILQENVVTFFCKRHNITLETEATRKLVNNAFYYTLGKFSSEKERQQAQERIAESEDLRQLLSDPLLNDNDTTKAFSLLTHERNDFNHSGMRPQPHSPKKIRDNIRHAFDILNKKLNPHA